MSGMNLSSFVRTLRGETKIDTRPNKALYQLPSSSDPDIQVVIENWNAVVENGVTPLWDPDRPRRQTLRPANHRSADLNSHHVRRHLRKGQRDGRYIIVDESMLNDWPEVFISPLGVVDKPGPQGPDIRIINDYSYPPGCSINDLTDRTNFPPIKYDPPSHIARRIHQLRSQFPSRRVQIMLGDVSGAFRHVPINADHVHMFVFRFDGHLVIDLACGFGWCGSPAFYSLAGSMINRIYTDYVYDPVEPFHGSVWCDDHTCVEIDHEDRCAVANVALRHAMATVLGPRAINEDKFTRWDTTNKALGLIWDTEMACVSIPNEKIMQARDRVGHLLASSHVTKTVLLKILGSLRHVANCFPPSRAFFQRLQCLAVSLPRYGHHRLAEGASEDLHWFQAVLCHDDRFNGIPVAQFAHTAEPDIFIFMDASDEGLCALDPASRRFIRVKFSTEERESLKHDRLSNSINIRELQSAVLAALVWGKRWSQTAENHPVHICFNIDNMSAVSWSNRRASRHSTAQLYNRLLSLAEFKYRLVCSARHLPGWQNVMADAGSRAWTDSHPLTATWTNLSASWSQDHVLHPFDNLSRLWKDCCVDTLWHTPPMHNIESIGDNGTGSLG